MEGLIRLWGRTSSGSGSEWAIAQQRLGRKERRTFTGLVCLRDYKQAFDWMIRGSAGCPSRLES